MSFPSPARDWKEAPLSLDTLCDISNPAVFLFRYGGEDLQFVKKNAVLVVDKSLTPHKDDLVIVVEGEDMVVRRFEDFPKDSNLSVEGVVTRVLNFIR
ncbi:MAG: hypothetical protein AAF564_12680 [Bacteroidota bacterium]